MYYAILENVHVVCGLQKCLRLIMYQKIHDYNSVVVKKYISIDKKNS